MSASLQSSVTDSTDAVDAAPRRPADHGETARGRRPLQIGAIRLPLPVVQAALSGYSDWAMRTIARRLGAPYTIHEVLIDAFVNTLKDRERTRRFLRVLEDDHPVGAQLMGSEPEEFGPAALRLVQAGFDVIDINFGCPMKRVRDRCRGGMHLGQPDVAIEILKHVRNVVPPQVPVTVKMRRGIDDSAFSRDCFFRILEAAVAIGIDAATIHGRTVEQKYVGPSRPEFLCEVRAAFPDLMLLGSGDLMCAADCVRMLVQTGVDGVTAARGSIGNPWIYQEAAALLAGRPLPPPPTVHAQRDVLEQHYELTCRIYPAESVCRQMRKFGIRYARLHPDEDLVRQAFIKVTDDTGWNNVLRRHYADDRPGVRQNPQESGSADETESP